MSDRGSSLVSGMCALAGLAIGLLLSGCSADRILRPDYTVCTATSGRDCEYHAIQIHEPGTPAEYELAFVEIDDQGQIRDRAQMEALFKGHDGRGGLYEMASRDSLLINVFVHGWHHNAAPGDANVESFKQSLAALSRLEDTLAGEQQRPRRKVVGVYVGWRGESIDVEYINTLTFWDRKDTAQEVGHLGMAELLLRLEEIRNVRNAIDPAIESRLVIVGHSFGGAAVYSATAQILADRFVDSRSGKAHAGDAQGFGDLVVLLNPAFEALRYASLHDLAESRCSYFAGQVPRLVILTSEADWATRYAFPLGQAVSTFFETHGPIERHVCGRSYAYHEGEADRQAVGHFTPFLTHDLLPAPAAGESAPLQATLLSWNGYGTGEVIPFGTTHLVPRLGTRPWRPYLDVRVDRRLIADHNDVFRPEILEFLRRLILISTTQPATTSTRP